MALFRALAPIAAFVTVTAPAAGQTDFASCVAGLSREAIAAGVPRDVATRAASGLTPDSSVVTARQGQPEFQTPIWDYFSFLVDDERIADGRERLQRWAPLLAELERRYAVDRHTVVAIWGVESDYGRIQGDRPLLRSLASAACLGRRKPFFRRQYVAALRIVARGDVPAEGLAGSWAGAFGQTQFMPTTFLQLAVDGDGDGRRDLIGSVPDALASTANFLSRRGWLQGHPWGYEVRVPSGYRGASGRAHRRPLARWRAAGVSRVDGTALPAAPATAALLRPAGAAGPAFLVGPNFDALYAYNASVSYALAIAHLADRLRGAGGFATAWPTDDPGLSRAERREVQRLLAELGYDAGPADGILGPRGRAALRAFQADAGLPPDGRAGTALLDALRQSADAR